MAPQGIKYAEDVLEVHQAYIAARDAGERADRSRNKLATLKASRAQLQEDLLMRESVVSQDFWAANPTMPVTRMEKQLRVEIVRDEECILLRTELRDIESDIDDHEVQVRQADTDVRIYTARMSELGGYLQYLAALKVAATSSTPTKPENQS